MLSSDFVLFIALLYVASSGLDQDTTQRLLACRDARTGARSLYLSVFATVPVVALFITIGLLSDGVWALTAGAARDWFARSPKRIAKLSGTGGVMMIGIGVAALFVPHGSD